MDMVLIHGMGRMSGSMLWLRRRLRQAGHRPILFGYYPTVEGLAHATGRLIKLIEGEVDTTHYALVGHSLGSVLIRNALAALGDRGPSACFFLAPPMVACKAAKFFSRWWPYRLLTGEMGRLLASDTFMQALPMPHVPTRIYVGTAGPRRPWLPFGLEANDFILSVSEATGAYGAHAIQLPCSHTYIMNSRQVSNDMIAVMATFAR